MSIFIQKHGLPPQGAGGLTLTLPSHNATDFRIFKLGNELLVTLI